MWLLGGVCSSYCWFGVTMSPCLLCLGLRDSEGFLNVCSDLLSTRGAQGVSCVAHAAELRKACFDHSHQVSRALDSGTHKCQEEVYHRRTRGIHATGSPGASCF